MIGILKAEVVSALTSFAAVAVAKRPPDAAAGAQGGGVEIQALGNALGNHGEALAEFVDEAIYALVMPQLRANQEQARRAC